MQAELLQAADRITLGFLAGCTGIACTLTAILYRPVALIPPIALSLVLLRAIQQHTRAEAHAKQEVKA